MTTPTKPQIIAAHVAAGATIAVFGAAFAVIAIPLIILNLPSAAFAAWERAEDRKYGKR